MLSKVQLSTGLTFKSNEDKKNPGKTFRPNVAPVPEQDTFVPSNPKIKEKYLITKKLDPESKLNKKFPEEELPRSGFTNTKFPEDEILKYEPGKPDSLDPSEIFDTEKLPSRVYANEFPQNGEPRWFDEVLPMRLNQPPRQINTQIRFENYPPSHKLPKVAVPDDYYKTFFKDVPPEMVAAVRVDEPRGLSLLLKLPRPLTLEALIEANRDAWRRCSELFELAKRIPKP